MLARVPYRTRIKCRRFCYQPLAACGESLSNWGSTRSISRTTLLPHGNGYPKERAIVVVDRHLGASAVARPSVLHAAECAARRSRLRSVRRGFVPGLLREDHGPTEPGAWPLLPTAAARLL